jgi:hypothetical protein
LEPGDDAVLVEASKTRVADNVSDQNRSEFAGFDRDAPPIPPDLHKHRTRIVHLERRRNQFGDFTSTPTTASGRTMPIDPVPTERLLSLHISRKQPFRRGYFWKWTAPALERDRQHKVGYAAQRVLVAIVGAEDQAQHGVSSEQQAAQITGEAALASARFFSSSAPTNATSSPTAARGSPPQSVMILSAKRGSWRGRLRRRSDAVGHLWRAPAGFD